MNEDTANDVLHETLTRVYDEAEWIGANEQWFTFTDVWSSPQEYPSDWYTYFALDSDTLSTIINDVAEEYGLNDREVAALRFTIILDYGPRSEEND